MDHTPPPLYIIASNPAGHGTDVLLRGADPVLRDGDTYVYEYAHVATFRSRAFAARYTMWTNADAARNART